MNYIGRFKKTASIEGVVQQDGFVQIEPYVSNGKVIENAAMFMMEWMRQNPECVGRTVRVSIELVPTSEEIQQARADEDFDEEFK